MKQTVFDCETSALAESEISQFMPEFEAPSNYRDPEKIKANIEEQRKAWFERAALSPLTGKVIAIGYSIDGEIMLRINPEDEKALIVEFWELLRTQWTQAQFIGFNIKRFDLPFLCRRSWRLGIAFPSYIRYGRYWHEDFVDLFEEWQLGDYQASISLDNLAKFLGIGQKSGSGADFAGFPRDKQESYLTTDIQLTAKAAKIMLPKET